MINRNKKLVGILGASIMAFALMGCGNNQVSDSLNSGKEALNNKQYEKAEDDFEIVLEQDPQNKEARILDQIVDNYLGAKDHFNDGEYREASQELKEIPNEYTDYKIKDDIDNLKNEVDFQMNKTGVVDGYIKKAEELVDQKKYDEAKKEIEKIDVNSPNQKQKEEINDINEDIRERD